MTQIFFFFLFALASRLISFLLVVSQKHGVDTMRLQYHTIIVRKTRMRKTLTGLNIHDSYFGGATIFFIVLSKKIMKTISRDLTFMIKDFGVQPVCFSISLFLLFFTINPNTSSHSFFLAMHLFPLTRLTVVTHTSNKKFKNKGNAFFCESKSVRVKKCNKV
jgi:hypothetical protein